MSTYFEFAITNRIEIGLGDMSHHYKNEKSAKELGADAFLAKPFYIDELFELVQQYVVAA